MPTDKSGAFQFPAPPDDFSVIAFGNAGYVQKSFRSGRSRLGELQLLPWGIVEGKVVGRDGKACPDFIVTIAAQKSGNAKPPAQTKTDQQGRFKMERVPPVACRIWAYSRPQQGVPSAAVEKKISVPPGEVVTVDLNVD